MRRIVFSSILLFFASTGVFASSAITVPIELTAGNMTIQQAAFSIDASLRCHALWIDDSEQLLTRGGPYGEFGPTRVVKREAAHLVSDPEVAVLASGHAALIWSARRPEFDWDWNLWFTFSPTSDPIQIIGDAVNDRHPAALARGDSLYIAWQRDGPPYRVAYGFATRARPYPPIYFLESFSDSVSNVTLGGTTGPTIWVAWNVHAETGTEIWLAGLRHDVIHSAPVRLRAGQNDRNPHVAADPTGRPHVVWEDSGAIRYTYGVLDTAGRVVSFAPSTLIASRDGNRPSIAFMPNGVAHISWFDAAENTIVAVNLVGGNVVGPVTLVEPRYQPSLDRMASGLLATSAGAIISPFVGVAPSNGAHGIWVAHYAEVSSNAFFVGFGAEVDATGAVRLTWSAEAENVARYSVVRIQPEAEPVFVDIADANHADAEYIVTDHPEVAGSYRYRVDAVGPDGAILASQEHRVDVPRTTAEPGNAAVPNVSAAPNPFNSVTAITIDTPLSMTTRVTIYDVTGRVAATFGPTQFTPGTHRVVWNADDVRSRTVGSGIYLVRATFRGEHGRTSVRTTRLTLIR